ncbi:MAG: hypothetical protein F6K09_28245, partial [Merismopedia sp. SIO2A8]|nr:hypothetical protein [Merismopedia sp. SIO2A8]
MTSSTWSVRVRSDSMHQLWKPELAIIARFKPSQAGASSADGAGVR